MANDLVMGLLSDKFGLLATLILAARAVLVVSRDKPRHCKQKHYISRHSLRKPADAGSQYSQPTFDRFDSD
jgi:hypothetical protein